MIKYEIRNIKKQRCNIEIEAEYHLVEWTAFRNREKIQHSIMAQGAGAAAAKCKAPLLKIYILQAAPHAG